MSISYRDQQLNALNSQNNSRKCTGCSFSEWMRLEHKPTWLLVVLWGFLCLYIFLSISSLILFSFSGHWSTDENTEAEQKLGFDKRKHNTLDCIVGGKRWLQGIMLCCSFSPEPHGFSFSSSLLQNQRDLWHSIWFQMLSGKLFQREGDWEVEDLGNAFCCLAPTIPGINFTSLHLWSK